MNWCLASELPFSEHHCSLSYQYELALLSSLAEHLSLCSPCNTPAQEGRCQPAFGMIKCLIIIMIVTMKIGIIGLSQWFESHEKQSYFKWWVHLFLSLNKYSLLYGSFPFCYRYLVSGTISNHETLICSTYINVIYLLYECVLQHLLLKAWDRLKFSDIQFRNLHLTDKRLMRKFQTFNLQIIQNAVCLFVFVEGKILTALKAVLKRSNLLVILSSTTPKKIFSCVESLESLW